VCRPILSASILIYTIKIMSQFGAAAADIIAWTCLPAGLSIAEIERERERTVTDTTT